MSGRWDVKEVAARSIGRLLALDARVMDRVQPVADGPLSTGQLAWSRTLEAGWSDVRRELDEALAAGLRLPETDDLVGVAQGAEGLWTTYVLFWHGQWPQSTCARFPRTVELLRSVPDLQIAGFTVLGPHTHIPAHRGPCRSLRYHLGVRVPGPEGACRLRLGAETVSWADGAGLAFDDLTLHEAWNDTEEDRYVLFAQTAWPVDGAAGLLHRLTDRVLAGSTRGVLDRTEQLDRSLNG